MVTLNTDLPFDGRDAPVSRHHVTAGRNLPVVAGRHANGRGGFAVRTAVSDEENGEFADNASGTGSPMVGDESLVFAKGIEISANAILKTIPFFRSIWFRGALVVLFSIIIWSRSASSSDVCDRYMNREVMQGGRTGSVFVDGHSHVEAIFRNIHDYYPLDSGGLEYMAFKGRRFINNDPLFRLLPNCKEGDEYFYLTNRMDISNKFGFSKLKNIKTGDYYYRCSKNKPNYTFRWEFPSFSGLPDAQADIVYDDINIWIRMVKIYSLESNVEEIIYTYPSVAYETKGFAALGVSWKLCDNKNNQLPVVVKEIFHPS